MALTAPPPAGQTIHDHPVFGPLHDDGFGRLVTKDLSVVGSVDYARGVMQIIDVGNFEVITPRRGGGCVVTDLSQVHDAAIRAKLIEMGWRPPGEDSGHKTNADQTVAVATDVYFNPDMSSCPRGLKVQLVGEGGVAVYGTYNGDPFWREWAPVPKRRKA